MQFVGYNTTEAQLYTTNQRIARVDNCNGFRAINTGDTPVRVNGQLLYPGTVGTNNGEGETIGGNLGEIYLGYIDIAFEAPIGARPEVSIRQKYYVLDTILNSQNLIR